MGPAEAAGWGWAAAAAGESMTLGHVPHTGAQAARAGGWAEERAEPGWAVEGARGWVAAGSVSAAEADSGWEAAEDWG